MGSAAYQKPTVNINKNVGNVTDSYNNVWNNCEISVSDEKRQILEWLSPMAPRERHQAVREGRTDGVGNWLLHTSGFEEWRTSANQDVNPILFYYGDPGVGKTYLSSLVIDTLCDELDGGNMAVACVYCDFHAHKEQSATSVLAVLLKQIVAGVEQIPKEIQAAFNRGKREVDGRALRLPEIRSMLTKSVSSLLRGFICIDALDEFPAKHRPELWDSLQRIIRECPNIRLFITGRPHIREEVRKYFPGYPDQPPIKPTEEDIREYLIMRLKNDPELDAMNVRLEADILRIIPDTISGAFLLVSLIMDAVLADATIHQRRQTLHKMTNGFGLDDAYSATLNRMREQKGNRVRLGMEALMWISRSERQLKAGELCQALGVELRTTNLNVDNVPSIRTLLSCTLGLVAIDNQASTARLVHFTLQEYLVAHPNLFITPHSMMAEICLTYLNFQSVCELSIGPDIIPSTMPFLYYASCYWGFHARKEMGEDVKRLALQLLQQDANHIWADILLREESVDFLSGDERWCGRSPDLRGFTGLHGVTYMGVTQVAIAMVDMKRWDLNGRDSKGETPLIWAAKYGNSTLTKLLLEQPDVDPTLSDNEGRTPLVHASRAGHQDVVKLLLEHGDVNPNSPDKVGWTPLSHAARSGHEGVVKLLMVHRGVNPDSPEGTGYTTVFHAIQGKHEGVAKLLLQQGDVNPNGSDHLDRTLLWRAASSGCESIVKLLLEQGDVDPDLPDFEGVTPLFKATACGREGIIRLLLQREDVDPNRRDQKGRTLLLYATRSRSEDAMKVILERVGVGFSLLDGDGMRALLYAAQSGSRDIVKLLLERLNLDLGGGGGQEVLAYAASSGCEDIVELFLERGYLDPDWSDEIGRTQLSYAAEGGCEGLVKLLLERGDVNPDLPDKYGRTPLSHLARRGYRRVGSLDVVKLLLQRGDVNPNTPDHEGDTPLHYAMDSSFEGLVWLLLKRTDVDPNPLGFHSRTPLSLAAGRGDGDLVKLLLERGDLNPDLPDRDGRTPLSLAAEGGNEFIVKLLLERGDVNPGYSDRNGLTPLAYATKSNFVGTMRLLSIPGPSSHETSENSGMAHQTPVPVLSTQEEMRLALISQHEGVIPDAEHEITEVIPLVRFDEHLSDQLGARPLSSIHTSTPISDTSPKSTTLDPSRPLERLGGGQPLLGPPSVPNGPGARQDPEDGLPRALDWTRRRRMFRPRL